MDKDAFVDERVCAVIVVVRISDLRDVIWDWRAVIVDVWDVSEASEEESAEWSWDVRSSILDERRDCLWLWCFWASIRLRLRVCSCSFRSICIYV